MTRAERAQRRDDRVEVAKRLAQEDERAQQHRLLAGEVGVAEQGPDGRGGREEPRVEDVHQLLASRRDEIEGCLEGLQIELHEGRFAAAACSRKRRDRRRPAGQPPVARWLSATARPSRFQLICASADLS
jgi:hypothetical protein